MSNDYDVACRRMVKADPLPFLRWLFRDFDQVAEHVGWVDTRRLPFPGKDELTEDLVFQIRLLRRVAALWALALEFQLEPDPDMFGRFLVYLGTLVMERHPDEHPGSRYGLAAAVVNLTGTTRAAGVGDLRVGRPRRRGMHPEGA